jgi:putative ABC transport system permease protein
MRDAAGVPGWVARILNERVLRDAFEPAWHEARSKYLSKRSGASLAGRLVAGFAFRLRTVDLLVQCLTLSPRSVGGDGVVHSFIRDVALAVRSLRRSPAFALLAIGTLSLGIGVTTAIFGVLSGVLLRPLPYEDARQLVTIDATAPQGFAMSISVPNLRDWREQTRVFSAVGAEAAWNVVLTSDQGAEVISGQLVGGDFFGVLGTAASIGRVFGPEQSVRGAEAEVVLGHTFWQRRFGGDRGVVGQSITLDGRPVNVVGVMPPGFGYPVPDVAMYFPLGFLSATLPWDDRGSGFGLRAIARLAPGATLASAQQDMERVMRGIEEQEGRPIATTRVLSLADFMIGSARGRIWLLMIAAAFVLLIAVANVANLVLARAESRRQEVAVRAALGAGRAALARQLLAEGATLSFAGALLGLVVAVGGVSLIRRFVPLPPLLAERVGIDVPTLGFTIAISALVGIVFGMIPAFRGSGSRWVASLRAAGRTTEERGRRRLRSALVIAEVAAAMVLAVGAGLVASSLRRLQATDAGFRARNVLTARVRTPRAPDAERWRAFYNEVVQRVRAQPGVLDAAATLIVPLADRSWELLVQPEGQLFDGHTGESVLYNIVSPEYFNTMSLPILSGRNFDESDRDGGAPVAIIDETMAARFWPGEDPIGKRIVFEEAATSTKEHPVGVYRTVVGVVPNVRHYDLRHASRIQVWVPLNQSLGIWGTNLFVAVRTAGDPAAFARPLQDIVQSIDRNVPLSDIRTIREYMSSDLESDRALSVLLGAFGSLALGLAAVGVFGVMSLVVAMRTREIGVRLAIGARPRQIMRLVLGRTLLLATTGTVLGLAAAMALSRLLASFLYEISPLDAPVYLAAGVCLIGVAGLAALLPALRATRIDPVRTLQDA